MKRLVTLAAGIALACLLAFASPRDASSQAGAANTVVLLTNAAATGTAQTWPGGPGVFAVVGTFGGATITLQFLGPDGTTWLAAGTATTVTAAGVGVFNLPKGSIRALITGGASVSVTANAAQLITFIG